MRLPILTNLQAVLTSWRTGNNIEPAVSYTGNGPELPESLLDELVVRLEAIKNRVGGSRDARIEFDKEAAVILGKTLKMTASAAAERRFWAYFGVVKAAHLVTWRWDKPNKADVTHTRLSGGVKDTFKRLWMRADIMKHGDGDEAYSLAQFGGEDFWVSVLERQISGCRDLMKAVVNVFFQGKKNGEVAQEEYRAAMLWLREVRPARVYEAMSPEENRALASMALSVARQRPHSRG